LLAWVGACGSSHRPGDAGVADGAAHALPDASVADAFWDGSGLKPCATDDDCTRAAEWCVSSRRVGHPTGTAPEFICVPCDNGGLLCDIFCEHPGWTPYERNGCYACECAPTNECTADAQCAPREKCYAGAFCTDYCAAGDPSCCLGNICEPSGCPDPPRVGCVVRGCSVESGFCVTGAGVCTSSQCFCGGAEWSCTRDCAGGHCVPPD
jgi:hypothetical protein